MRTHIKEKNDTKYLCRKRIQKFREIKKRTLCESLDLFSRVFDQGTCMVEKPLTEMATHGSRFLHLKHSSPRAITPREKGKSNFHCTCPVRVSPSLFSTPSRSTVGMPVPPSGEENSSCSSVRDRQETPVTHPQHVTWSFLSQSGHCFLHVGEAFRNSNLFVPGSLDFSGAAIRRQCPNSNSDTTWKQDYLLVLQRSTQKCIHQTASMARWGCLQILQSQAIFSNNQSLSSRRRALWFHPNEPDILSACRENIFWRGSYGERKKICNLKIFHDRALPTGCVDGTWSQQEPAAGTVLLIVRVIHGALCICTMLLNEAFADSTPSALTILPRF